MCSGGSDGPIRGRICFMTNIYDRRRAKSSEWDRDVLANNVQDLRWDTLITMSGYLQWNVSPSGWHRTRPWMASTTWASPRATCRPWTRGSPPARTSSTASGVSPRNIILPSDKNVILFSIFRDSGPSIFDWGIGKCYYSRIIWLLGCAPFYSNKQACIRLQQIRSWKVRKYFFCKPWSHFLQSIFGKAGGRAEEGTGGTTQSTLTDRGQWAGAGGKMVAVTIISEKVIISSTRSEEGRLLSRSFSRMTARIQENCTAPLPRAVRLRILNLQNLAIREKKWQHQAEICHHQNQQNIWWTLRIVLNVICEALVQSKKVFYGSRETSCSQGRIKSSFWN